MQQNKTKRSIHKLQQHSEHKHTVTWEENLQGKRLNVKTKQGQRGELGAAEGLTMDNLSGLSGCGATEGQELTGGD